MKRSNAPIYWSLFGAGGMLSALFGPGLVLAVLCVTTGVLIAPDALGFARLNGLAHGIVAKAFLFATASLFLWHAAHRMFHTLHDFGIRTGAAAWVLCYGVALAGTLLSAWALLRIGF
jgi:fumarate reductase subunit D